MSDFYKRLNELCIKKSTTVTGMLKDMKISTQNGTKWKNGTLPNGDTLIKLSEYLNTSIDYLLRGISTEEQQPDELTREILNHISEMNTVQKAKLLTEMTKELEESAERKEKKSS